MDEIRALNRACDALSIATGICSGTNLAQDMEEFMAARAELLALVQRRLSPAPAADADARAVAKQFCTYTRQEDSTEEYLAALISAYGSSREKAAREEIADAGGWRREEGRTYLMIRVADGADLSCKATRRDALAAASRSGKDGGGK